MQLKETLQHILTLDEAGRAHYVAEQGDALLPEMLANIGHIEEELRDQLNYRVFIELLSAGHFSHAQLERLAKAIGSKEYLLFGMAEPNGGFTRSFSALWLTGLLHADRQLSYLNSDDAGAILETAAYYMQRERDVRGLTEHGWVHSMAHAADLGIAIIQHPAFQIRFAPILLEGIKSALWKGRVYTDDEDERFAKLIPALAAVDFPEVVLLEWVEQLTDKLARHSYMAGYDRAFYEARTNTLQLLRALYFNLKFTQRYDKLRGTVSILIQEWMK